MIYFLLSFYTVSYLKIDYISKDGYTQVDLCSRMYEYNHTTNSFKARLLYSSKKFETLKVNIDPVVASNCEWYLLQEGMNKFPKFCEHNVEDANNYPAHIHFGKIYNEITYGPPLQVKVQVNTYDIKEATNAVNSISLPKLISSIQSDQQKDFDCGSINIVYISTQDNKEIDPKYCFNDSPIKSSLIYQPIVPHQECGYPLASCLDYKELAHNFSSVANNYIKEEVEILTSNYKESIDKYVHLINEIKNIKKIIQKIQDEIATTIVPSPEKTYDSIKDYIQIFVETLVKNHSITINNTNASINHCSCNFSSNFSNILPSHMSKSETLIDVKSSFWREVVLAIFYLVRFFAVLAQFLVLIKFIKRRRLTSKQVAACGAIYLSFVALVDLVLVGIHSHTANELDSHQ